MKPRSLGPGSLGHWNRSMALESRAQAGEETTNRERLETMAKAKGDRNEKQNEKRNEKQTPRTVAGGTAEAGTHVEALAKIATKLHE